MSGYQTPHFQGISKEELAQSEARGIHSSIAIVTVIATIGVVLRFVSRRKSKAGLSYDDYTIVAALLLSYGLSISIILDTALYGLGRHLPAVKPTQLPNFQKTTLVISIFYFTTSAATKASLLLLYYRYFGISKPFRLALYVSAGIILSYYASLFFATIFQCVPVAAFWDRTIKKPNVCAVSIVRLVCAVLITRMTSTSQVNGFDSTWESRNIIVWSSVEQSIGVLSACLPTLRPLFGEFLSLSSRTAMTVKTGSGAKKSAGATKSTIRPVSPRRDWGFKRLDEEATLVGQPLAQESSVIGNEDWDGSNAGPRTYKMGSVNNKRLPKIPWSTKTAVRQK